MAGERKLSLSFSLKGLQTPVSIRLSLQTQQPACRTRAGCRRRYGGSRFDPGRDLHVVP